MIRFSFILTVIAYISIYTCFAFGVEKVPKGGTIEGEVIDATQEQTPIEGVEVKITSNIDAKNYTTLTNAKGEFKITGLPAGRYTISISKKGYNPRSRRQEIFAAGDKVFERIKMRKKDDIEKRMYEGLLQHVAEDIGKRYKLNGTIVEALRKSILEAFNNVMEQENQELKDFAPIEDYAGTALIIAMLSKPDYKSTFAKYLTEKQIQDYINYTKARKHNVQKASIQLITAFLDQELNLSDNQRENFTKLMLDSQNGKSGTSFTKSIMAAGFRKAVVNLLQNDLKIPMNSILSQTQYKIWQILVNMQDDHRKLVSVELSEMPSENTAKNDRTNENPTNSPTWILAEAILMTHIEQLGALNESASKRLEIVTKGVIQQYIEMEIPDINDNFEFISKLGSLAQAVMLQNIPHKQALENLESVKKELWGENNMNDQWKRTELNMIANHPLFQQAIKDVLSEDVYLLYKARQTKREKFRALTIQNFTEAYWDMILLFNNTQRNKLKKITAHMTLPSLSSEGLQVMFLEYFIWMDNKILNPWQKNALKAGR